MNIYSPGWFGNLKHVETWAPEDIHGRYQGLKFWAKQESAAGVPKHIQHQMLDDMDFALMEDGVY